MSDLADLRPFMVQELGQAPSSVAISVFAWTLFAMNAQVKPRHDAFANAIANRPPASFMIAASFAL